MRNSKLAALILVPFAALMLGCGGSSYSYVKVIHAYPGSGAPNVDVQVGGTFAAQNLAFGQASSSYAKVGAGTSRNIQIFPAGKDSTPLLTASSTLSKNQYYTVIAATSGSSLGATVLNDNLLPPTSGDFKVRVIHEADTAGTVDVYVTAPDTVINNPASPVTPTIANFTVGTVSSYLQVPAGTYRIRVTPAGNPSTVAIDTGAAGVTLAAGNIYTAVALDPNPNSSNPTAFSLLLTQDQPVPGVTPTAPTTSTMM